MKKQDKKQNKKQKKKLGIHGIQFKLFALFLVPVICMTALGYLSYQRASSVVINNSKVDTQQTLHMLSQYYKAQFDMVQSQIDVYYKDMEMQQYLNGEYTLSDTLSVQFYNSSLSSVKKRVWSDERISSIELVSKNAKSIMTNGHENENMYAEILETPEGQKMAESDHNYVWFGRSGQMDEIMGTAQDGYLFRVGINFRNVSAMGFAEVKESAISAVMEGLDFGENSIVGILSTDGTELVYDGENFSTAGGVFGDYLDMAEQGEGNGNVEYNGESHLFLYAPVIEDQIYVCVLIPESYFLEQTDVIRNITVLLVIIASVLAMIIGNVFAGSLSKSIHKINRMLDQIAKGDFTVRLNLKRKDEFMLLADGVNHMADHVCRLVKEVSEVGTVLSEEVEKVAGATNKFVGSTGVIKNSLGEIELGVEQLNKNSADSLSQMQVLSSQFSLVNENTARIGDATEQTNHAISEGLQTMQKLTERTGDTTKMMTHVSQTMETLQERIEHIGTIVNAIDDIAEQTTMLSLNASIEAARAGESGRGFGVVADEIRKLADQSLVSADKIRSIIQEITEQTREAGESVGNAYSSVNEQKTVVEHTTESFWRMNEQTRVLTAQVQEILGYIQSMENARRTTEDAMQGISVVAEQTAASASEVYKTTEVQALEAVKLQQAAGQMNDWADKLQAAIAQFTVEK